jgi:hypothetical protein
MSWGGTTTDGWWYLSWLANNFQVTVTSASLAVVIITYLFISEGGIVFRKSINIYLFKMLRRDFASSLPIVDINKNRSFMIML